MKKQRQSLGEEDGEEEEEEEGEEMEDVSEGLSESDEVGGGNYGGPGCCGLEIVLYRRRICLAQQAADRDDEHESSQEVSILAWPV